MTGPHDVPVSGIGKHRAQLSSSQAVTIIAAAAVDALSGEAAVGLVVRDDSGQVIQRTGKAIGKASGILAAYRALLHALWRGRALGARTIHVRCEGGEAVAEVQGETDVPPERIGSYLQVRALLNAYREVKVEIAGAEGVADAAALARAALARKLRTVDALPLWAGRSA